MKFASKPSNFAACGGLAGCRAFTLAEVLAALVFMAILIPVAMEGLSIASRVGISAARKSEAVLIAERVLNESVVLTNWSQAVQNGSLRQGLSEFQWTLRSEPWTVDQNQSGMLLLSVEVAYQVQGQDQKIRLNTLVDQVTPYLATNSL
jgi:hypothetical protein